MSGMCGIDLFEPYALSGRAAWGDVNPGLKPWAKSSCPIRDERVGEAPAQTLWNLASPRYFQTREPLRVDGGAA
jgi:hypothetical protein